MEDESLIVDILENIFGEPRNHNHGRGQISFDCPVCSHEIKGLDKGDGKGNLEVNYDQHVFKCWACAETHNTKGHLGYLIDRFGGKKDREYYELVRPDDYERAEKEYKKLKLPEEYQRFSDVHPVHIKRREAYNYLKRRGITDEIIEKYDIGFAEKGEYAGRIIVPSYDLEGELNYFVARSWYPREKFKYKNPQAPKELLIFNESRIDWKEDIFLVEGVFDGFFVPNSIPLLGKFVSDLLWETLYDKSEGRIKICLDGDAWLDAIRVYEKLSGGRLYGKIDIIKLPKDKDLGDLRGEIKPEYYVELEKQ
jgi:hypothetical protein